MAMGCASWAHSSSSSSPSSFLPLLSTCSILLPAAIHGRLRLSSATLRLKSPLRVVRCAQSKRGSSSFKELEIASPADFYFDPPLKIVEYPDPVLRAKNKRIDAFDDSLKKLVEEMFDIMYKFGLHTYLPLLNFVAFSIGVISSTPYFTNATDGIGLSAPQVGINVQLMVFNSVGERGKGEEIVLVNPRIYKYSKKTVLFNEGCLSFPGIYADVERPETVKVDARDAAGARFAVNLSGLPARVFQHEFDHLQLQQ